MSEKGLTWIRTLKCKELIKKELGRIIDEFLEDLKKHDGGYGCPAKFQIEKWEAKKNEGRD